jgi:hypothetical protein
MKRDRFCVISPKKSSYTMERDRSKVFKTFYVGTYIRFYSAPVKRIRQRIGQALAHTILRNKLGHGGGFGGSMGDKERVEKVRHLAIEIGELLNKREPSLGDGLDALTTVMLTAIEATHGREKADEFDLLVARFSAEVRRFSGVRVQ